MYACTTHVRTGEGEVEWSIRSMDAEQRLEKSELDGAGGELVFRTRDHSTVHISLEGSIKYLFIKRALAFCAVLSQTFITFRFSAQRKPSSLLT